MSEDASSVRLCLSGSSACAGLSPCEACRTALAQYVIPFALSAAGVADQEGVLAYIDGYNDARRRLLQEIARAQAAQRTNPTEPLDKPTEPSSADAFEKQASSTPVQRAPRKPAGPRKPLKEKHAASAASEPSTNGAVETPTTAPDIATNEEDRT